MTQSPTDPPRRVVVRRSATTPPPGSPDMQAPTQPAATPPWAPHEPSHPETPHRDTHVSDAPEQQWAYPPPAPESRIPLRKDVERPHPLTGIARSWIALFGLVLVFGRDVAERGLESIREMGPFMWIVLGLVVAVVVFNLVWGIIEWRTTTFVADDEEFRIERDFLSRDSTRIAYTKIQAVDIERSLPARLLGLSSVTIDVGGAGGKKLEFLAKQRADVLRDQLLARMKRQAVVPADAPISVDGVDGAQGEPAHPLAPAPAVVPAHTVVQMMPATLLKGVLVSSFLPWLLAGLAFLVVMLSLGEGFSIAALGGIVFGFGGYLWTQVVNNWNFRLSQGTNGLHLSRGLFTTQSQSLKPDRIQAVSIHQDYLQRLTGLYRMRVTVLGFSGGESGQTSGVVLPYGTHDDVRRVLAAFWPGIDLDAIALHRQPSRARWLTPLGFKRHLWGADDQTVVAHHGWLDHTITLVPHRRMQSLGLAQGPLQRKLSLATVALHTTDGPVSMSLYHLDTADARRFFDAQRDRARAARASTAEPGYLSALPAPAAADFIDHP